MTYTAFQTYKAMFLFIEIQWEKNNKNELGAMLGSMSFMGDGLPADQAMWYDWLRCLKKVKPYALTELDGFKAMLEFSENFITTYYDDDIQALINEIKECLEDKRTYYALWHQWLEQLKKVRDHFDGSKEKFNDYDVFQAAQLFLDQRGYIVPSEIIKTIRYGMYVTDSGVTKDPDAWDSWLACLRQVKHTNIFDKTKDRDVIILLPREGLHALRLYIELHYKKIHEKDLETLLNEFSFDNDGYPKDPAVWEEWTDCFRRLNNHQARMILHTPKDIIYMP